MNASRSLFLVGFVAFSSIFASEAISDPISDFSLNEEEKKELQRIEKIKKDFFKKYPGWFDSYEDVPFSDYRFEKKLEQRKLKQKQELEKKAQEEEQKRLIEEENRRIKKAEEERLRIEEEKKKSLEEQKRLEEERRKAEEERIRKEEEERIKKAEALKKLLDTPLGRAMQLYKDGKFKEAYDAFYVLFEKDIENPRINFYLGLSASGAGAYEDAVSAFERVLIKEPTHLRARLEMAKAQFFLKNFDDAEKQFLNVLATKDLPENVIANIEKFLDAIEATRKRNHFQSIAMLGVKFDDNINNDVGENTPIKDLVVGGQIISDSGNEKVSDFIHEEMINLNHIYDFGKVGDYYMQNSFMVFAQNYSGKSYDNGAASATTDDKNLLFYSISTGLGTNTKTVTFLTKIHYDSISIAGSELMSVSGIEMSYARPFNDSIAWDTKLKYQQKDFVEKSNDGMDSTYTEINLGAKKNIADSKDVFSFGFMISQERANVAANTDNDTKNIRASYMKNFDEKLSSTLGYGYKMVDYLEKSASDVKARADTQHNLSIGAMYKYTPKTMINGALNYFKNDSTRDAFCYDKAQVGANVMFIF